MSDHEKRVIGIEQLYKEEKMELLEKYINEMKKV